MPSYSGIFTLQAQMQAIAASNWPPFVPGAPTIGTATQTGSTTATVVFTAPANDGYSVITSYTATSSPGSVTGTLSQAGSGTITITGLSPSTSYTFTVTATNAVGTSAASAASNSITTALPAVGSAFGGGFFAGQIGVSSVATHNLIVAPRSSGQLANVYKNANSDTPGADSDIDGPANTAAQVADGNSTVYPCGHFCNNLSTGGQTDWYMPAKNELEICYYNLKPGTNNNDTSSGINPNAVPARASNYTSGDPAQTSSASFVESTGAERFSSVGYWCSNQNNSSTAKKQRFNDAYQGISNKGYGSNTVRAVRRVAV